jgi:sugar phosphate permease
MVTAFCAVAIAINYIDRATISIANLNIRQDFGLSATQIGGLLSAWSLCYALSQLPTGFLVDRFGARVLVGAGLFIWSVAQGAGGLAASYGQLLWSRAVLGVSEAPAYPSSARVITNWYPVSERGLPTGVYTAASTLAPAIAPPLLTGLMLAFGWRAMFAAMGVLGIVASVIWIAFYRDATQVELSPQDREHVAHDEQQSTPPITASDWLRLLRSRTVLGLFLGSFCLGFCFWIHGGWLPAFLETQYHVSLAKTGMLAAIPWLGGVAGAMSGGTFSDLLFRRGVSLVNSKRIPLASGILGLGLFTGLAAIASSATLALICITLALYCAMITNSGLWTGASALAPRSCVASVATIFNCAAYLGATCSPIVTGFIVDRTGSFVMALLVGAAVGIIGSCCYALLVTQPVIAEEAAGTAVLA